MARTGKIASVRTNLSPGCCVKPSDTAGHLGEGGGGRAGVERSVWCGRERDLYGATLFLAAVNRAELLKCHLYF